MMPDHDPTRTSPSDVTRSVGPSDLTLAPAPDADATRPQADPTTATGAAAAAVRQLITDTGGSVSSPPPAASAIDPPPGFVLERELGVGGMGVVYLARQVGLNRLVALKLVKSTEKVDGKALIRFLAEAEAVASVRHPHVVEVYQYGEHAGKPYMALEFCPGGDLTTLSKAERTRDAAWFRQVARLMADVADGVNAAHALGIVHRDLKPHNVFLTADGTPKVADFGLAKRGLGSDLTNTDAVMGTPAYMAPEQAGGGTKFVGPEADVWALGVMLFELLCGERPIDPSGPMLDALARVVKGEVSQLRTKAPTVPTDLALIAHKCLSVDPRDRYPTAGGLADDLHNWLDGKPISARPAGVIEQAVKWARRNRRLATMGAAMLLTMATATGVSLAFGADANEQRKKAEGETKRADAEKKAAIDAHVEADLERKVALAARNETQQWLGRTVLGPISSGPPGRALTKYEQAAIWQLSEYRDRPAGIFFLTAATETPLAAAQFECRGQYLIHAAVGLDSLRAEEADALITSRLNDPTLAFKYSGPRKLDRRLSYTGEPRKGNRWRASGRVTQRRSRPRSPWRP